jgi:hypothetical protein
MIGVGTASRVARPRVSGAMMTRFGAAAAPSWMGSNRLLILSPPADQIVMPPSMSIVVPVM